MVTFKDLEYDITKLGYKPCEGYLFNEAPRLNYCYGTNKSPNALLIGDSHAEDKFYGIENSVEGLDWRLLGNTSCPPLYQTQFREDETVCTEKLTKLFSYIGEEDSLKLVVVSFAQLYPLGTLHAPGRRERSFDPNKIFVDGVSTPTPEKATLFYAGLDRTLRYLQSLEIKTILLLDIPELTFHPQDCLNGNGKVSCTFDRGEAMKRQAIQRQYIEGFLSTYKGLRVFDPLDIFCSADDCQILKEGRSMYRDSHHLSHYGSLVYGQAFANWYAKQGR